MTFAIVIMPATMVGILPIGGLLVRSGSLRAEDFVTIIILSVGLITPLITCMSYSDDIRTMTTIIDQVRDIVEAEEMKRPNHANAPVQNDLVLKDVHFSYQEKEVLHGIDLQIQKAALLLLWDLREVERVPLPA